MAQYSVPDVSKIRRTRPKVFIISACVSGDLLIEGLSPGEVGGGAGRSAIHGLASEGIVLENGQLEGENVARLSGAAGNQIGNFRRRCGDGVRQRLALLIGTARSRAEHAAIADPPDRACEKAV